MSERGPDWHEEAITVAQGYSWVGVYDPDSALQCNTYLLVDGDSAIVFDCGAMPTFPKVMRKIIDVVAPDKISAIVVSHQDPDVCGALPIFEEVIGRPDLRIFAHSRTVALIRHMGLSSELVSVDLAGWRHTLPSGRDLDFVGAPYLHSPGSIVTHDPESETLISGDVFGALDEDGQWDLVAGAGFPERMAHWHQEYMSSGSMLRRLINRLRPLPITRILPQHGSVLEGPMVEAAYDLLSDLECGTDLLGEED